MKVKISNIKILTLFIWLLFPVVFFSNYITVHADYISELYTPLLNNTAGRISNPFVSSDHTKGHWGIDIGQTSNADDKIIYSAGPGKVICGGICAYCSDGTCGNYVEIEHTLADGSKVWTRYQHLSQVYVSAGDTVTENTQIGYMGTTGNSNGIHLHFEITTNNQIWGGFLNPTQVYFHSRGQNPPPTTPTLTIPNPSGLTPTPSNLTPTPSVTGNPLDPLQDPNDSLKSYYLNTPSNWNMDSCEKVVVSGPQSDIITGWVDVPKCNGHSSVTNDSILCSKKWVAAYAETVSIDNFPLLGLLSSSEPTQQNQVRPACYYNVTKNITKDVLAEDNYGNIIPNQYEEQLMNFTKDYMGLLNLSSASKYVNIGYPKLGTGISCTTLNWDDNLYSPKFDIQLYNRTLPDIPSTKPTPNSGTGDTWWTKLIDWIKSAYQWLVSLKDTEKENLKPVSDFVPGRDSVCQCSTTDKITVVNESDPVLPVEGAKKVVVNENKEIKDWTNTQICDFNYNYDNSEVIKGLTGCGMTGIINPKSGDDWVKGSPGASLESVYDESHFEYKIIYDINGIPIGKVCLYGVFCGAQLSCGTSIATMYAQCRGSGLSVQEVDGAVTGSPKYQITEPGFDKLTIPGMNKALYNAQVAIEQINSSFDVQYGLNIGVRLPSTRIVYDLNSKNIAYTPDKVKGKELDPLAVKTSLKYFISYKKTDYNYRFLDTWDEFTKVGDTVKADYYFPYIGKLPYMFERISVINTNENEPKTAASLLKKPILDELIYDPQILYCSDLTADQKLKQDCFTQDICGDLMTNYLEKNSLSFFNCSGNNPNGPGAPNPPIPTGPPGPTEPPGPPGPPITVTPGPIPTGPFTCEVIHTVAEAKAFIATVVAKYPDKLKIVDFAFTSPYSGCDSYTSTIRCNPSAAGQSWMTNKLIFHELMHQSRQNILSGGALNATSELQASIMEDYVVSGSCLGGAYVFEGKDSLARPASALLSSVLALGMTENQLWDFALGKSDTLTQYISQVISGGSKFLDVYCKNYGIRLASGVDWYGSPIACSSGSGDSGSKNTNLASVLAATTVGNPSAGYCAANVNNPSPKIENNSVFAGVYGGLGGWGALKTATTAQGAITVAQNYSNIVGTFSKVDSSKVVPLINPSLASAYATPTVLNDMINQCGSQGCIVMIDIQKGDVKSLIDKYTINANVWFDLDLEWFGRQTASQINDYAAYYNQVRTSKGYTSLGVFGFWDFAYMVDNPTSLSKSVGNVMVAPLFDGGASKAIKWTSTKNFISHYGRTTDVGLMEFITTWGSKYDSGFTPEEYYNDFVPQIFIAQ